MGNTSSIPAFSLLSLGSKHWPNLLAPLCGVALKFFPLSAPDTAAHQSTPGQGHAQHRQTGRRVPGTGRFVRNG